MTRGKKTILIIISVVAFLAVLVVVLNVFIENRIQSRLQESLGESSGYESLDFDLLRQRLQVKGLHYEGNARQFSVKEVELSGINYYQYLVNDKIKIDDVVLVEPQVLVIKNDSTNDSRKRNFKKEIHVSNLEARNGLFRYKKKDSVGNEIYLRFPEFSLSEVSIDSSTLNQKIPLNYSSYHFKGDSLRVNINPEHFIAAGAIDIDNGTTNLKDFRIIPYYEEGVFDQKVPYEKDRISLRVDSIYLKDLKFHFEKDTLYLKNPLTTVSGGDAHIYRNKALPDDPSVRPLYSQVLRRSPVKLDFETVEVNKSKIEYEEKTEPGRAVARIGFYDIDGEIKNVTNINMDRNDFPRTTVNANALLQKVSPVHLDWSFNAGNPEDKFFISGEFGKVPADAINPLLIPSRGIKAKGAINEAYFTFTGNDDFLTGDVKMTYDDFKILLLEEDSRDKKGFLSALANLFVDNDGVSGDNAVENVRVQRDKNRSFWNFIWSGIRKGMKDILGQL